MISIECIKEILDNLPEISLYFIPGAIFISIFDFITSKITEDKSYYIFKSFIVSQILLWIHELFQLVVYRKEFLLILFAIIGGYIFGQLYHSPLLEKFLGILKIHRTTNMNFWEDVTDFKSSTYIVAKSKNKDITYEGIIFKLQNRSENPNIMIYNYKVSVDGNVVEESNYGRFETIVINVEDMESIYITYNDKSEKAL